jgi:hypothetical protein
MSHDQLFKEVLQAHLQDFLELFFPDVAARLNLDSPRFRDKEFFTDFPKGSRREADVVAELKTHEGAPELVLVHIEVELQAGEKIAQRMFEYYALLRHRYQLPVFPVVVYLHGGQGLRKQEYKETLFERELIRFSFMSIGLAKLEAKEYVEKSPLAAALAALMNRRRVRDRFELRANMLRQIAKGPLDDAKKFLLGIIVETYFELDEGETERFRRFLWKRGYREVEKMEGTWADKMMDKGRIEGLLKGREQGREEGHEQGREEGHEQGREEGHEQGFKDGTLEGKRGTLMRLLTAKFGSVSEETKSRIQALESISELDVYLERVLTAESIEDMGL